MPEDVRRFILTSVPSVPYLEAMMLLRADPESQWGAQEVAQRLYVSERAANDVLAQLRASGVLEVSGHGTLRYRYSPVSEELREIIDRLAAVYATHIVEVTNLIHSSVDRKAQQFSNAFDWRKDS